MFDILPLKAIIFQLLILVLTIAAEALVIKETLQLGKKTCVLYAATANLLSTTLGWFVFFIAESSLPSAWRVYLINYIFFDQISNFGIMVGIAFLGFMGAFIVKLQSLEWLELLLEIRKPVVEKVDPAEVAKFRGRPSQKQSFGNLPTRALAILWANCASFSIVVAIVLLRMWANLLSA